MKYALKDISTIQTGLFAKPGVSGEFIYLQPKYFDENGKLIHSLHPDIKSDGIAEKHILRSGDILFAAKGAKNFAVVYESHNPPAVASTSFFVMRIKPAKVTPEYFAWFINSGPTQAVLKNQAMGTSITSISKAALETLEIEVPKITIQEKIVRVTKLWEKEKALVHEIELLREKHILQHFYNAIKNLDDD